MFNVYKGGLCSKDDLTYLNGIVQHHNKKDNLSTFHWTCNNVLRGYGIEL